MEVLENCQPKEVMHWFEELSKIPRGSGNEQEVIDYIFYFANVRWLVALQDDANNLVIRKKGTAGYEESPIVIIQGHIDMVCEKNKSTVHDFLKDPIKLIVDGDFIRADGTTLGADNGIAVAYAMALLDSNDIPHPPLEVVITTDEEAGMNGASSLSANSLNGKTLLNIDSEEEGVFLSSCAGGLKTSFTIPTKFANRNIDEIAFSLSITGLKGGHSGTEINKERGNSNRILARTLNELTKTFDYNLFGISGGSKDNAIPREAESLITIKESEIQNFTDTLNEIEKTIKHEFETIDPNLKIELKKSEKNPNKIFTKETTKKIITSILLIPNGIQAMSKNIQGLVETSNNIGVVATSNDHVKITCALRSSVISRKYLLLDQIQLIADLVGAELTSKGDYPAWEFNKNSPIREVFTTTYKEMTGKDATIEAVHAGLECGIFAKKIPNIDMISFGPNIFDAHTPDEKMSISSVAFNWELIKNVLVKLK